MLGARPVRCAARNCAVEPNCLLDQVHRAMGGKARGSRCDLTFKRNADDMRDNPSLDITAYPYECATRADCLAILTEWISCVGRTSTRLRPR